MRIVALTSVGRFPTVSHDTGLWWDRLSERSDCRLERFSANAAWWRLICSSRFRQQLLRPLGWLDSVRRRAEWTAAGLELDGVAAGEALDALRREETFAGAASYVRAVGAVAHHIEDANRSQPELTIDLSAGPRVTDLDYDDSAGLVGYAARDSLLRRTVEESLANCPEADVALLAVTSPEDLLTTIMIARFLRVRRPGIHISLIDHGYENFSLHSRMSVFRGDGGMAGVFDTVVASKDDRDAIVPALVTAIAAGASPRGVLGRFNLSVGREEGRTPHPPPPVETFSPQPIFWTRLSARRCYWSRCTYCAQNSKYESGEVPGRAEILASLDRVEAAIAAGCRWFYFSDEALSPATLRVLAEEIERRELDIHWACRCKLERAHTPELVEQLGRSGCYEILFGLETTSPRVLKLMDKHVEGLDEAAIGRVLTAMQSAGVGIHVNLIAGYPGDTRADSERSVDFLIATFRRLRSCTYVLNAFALLADTPLANEPQRFGLGRVWLAGDLAQSCNYELPFEFATSTRQALESVPELRDRLAAALGWRALGEDVATRAAVELYFGSGHGSLFKARRDNPFANPLVSCASS